MPSWPRAVDSARQRRVGLGARTRITRGSPGLPQVTDRRFNRAATSFANHLVVRSSSRPGTRARSPSAERLDVFPVPATRRLRATAIYWAGSSAGCNWPGTPDRPGLCPPGRLRGTAPRRLRRSGGHGDAAAFNVPSAGRPVLVDLGDLPAASAGDHCGGDRLTPGPLYEPVRRVRRVPWRVRLGRPAVARHDCWKGAGTKRLRSPTALGQPAARAGFILIMLC